MRNIKVIIAALLILASVESKALDPVVTLTGVVSCNPDCPLATTGSTTLISFEKFSDLNEVKVCEKEKDQQVISSNVTLTGVVSNGTYSTTHTNIVTKRFSCSAYFSKGDTYVEWYLYTNIMPPIELLVH